MARKFEEETEGSTEMARSNNRLSEETEGSTEMARSNNRLSALMPVALVAVLAIVIAGCGSSGGATSSSSGGGAGGSKACKRQYKVALAMSYVGNDWQIEARNMVVAESKTPPYDKCVKLDQYVAGPDVEKQIQQLQQMVAKQYDAIVLYPISPTALNQVIGQACSRKIVVVAYDAEVTNPCAYNVHINQTAAGKLTADWLAKAMHGKGNLVLSTGVPGTSVDTDRTNGAKSVFSKYPGIKTIASVSGMWDQAVSQQTMSRVLASQKDIHGVWGQVGYGNLLAFQNAKLKPPPMVGESENGFRVAIQDGDVEGISYGSPPYTGAYALKMAVAVLNGQTTIPKQMFVPLPLNTKDQLKLCTNVTKGCNTFPLSTAATGFFDDFYDKSVVPELCLSAIQTGTPCPGKKAKPPVDHSFPASATSRA